MMAVGCDAGCCVLDDGNGKRWFMAKKVTCWTEWRCSKRCHRIFPLIRFIDSRACQAERLRAELVVRRELLAAREVGYLLFS